MCSRGRPSTLEAVVGRHSHTLRSIAYGLAGEEWHRP